MVDSNFENWLAGFIDGEGCFYIATAGRARPGVLRPRFSLTLRCDDRAVLEAARSGAGGIGSMHEYEPTGPGRRVARWMIQSQADCEELCRILDRAPLRSKKARDYTLWRASVEAASGLSRGRGAAESRRDAVYAQLAQLKSELKEVRQYDDRV